MRKIRRACCYCGAEQNGERERYLFGGLAHASRPGDCEGARWARASGVFPCSAFSGGPVGGAVTGLSGDMRLSLE